MLLLAVPLLFQSAAADPAVLFQAGRVAEAERTLKADLARSPSDPRSLMLMAVVLDSQKRYAEAEPYYRRAAKAAPDAPAVWNNFGNHWIAVGNAAEARKAFEKVVALASGHSNANLQLGRLAVEARDGAGALRYLRAAGADRADDTAVQGLYARALALGGDYAHAEQLFSSALDRNPNDLDTLYNLGLAALNAGHRDRAIEALTIARQRKPDDADVLVALARAYLDAGKLDPVFEALTEARRIAPKREDVYGLLARACTVAGFYADAAQAWDEYLKLKPSDETARRERAFALVRGGGFKNGLPELESYVTRHPDDSLGHFQLGVAYTVTDPARSAKELTRSIELDPKFADGYYVRGALLLREGKAAEAAKDLEHSIALAPNNARALDQLGQAYRDSDRAADAERVLRQAAALDPKDGAIAMHLGYVLRDNGKADEARVYLAKFKELGVEQKRMAPRGLLDFLSLPAAEQRKQYLANARRALAESPRNADLRLRLGSALLANGETDEAEKVLGELAGGDAALTAGRSLMDAGRYAAARRLLERAGDAGRPDLATTIFHLNGVAPALALLDSVPDQRRDGDYWLVRAQVLDAKGDVAAATEALNRGLSAAPTRADLLQEAALFLLKHEKFDAAASLLDQAVRTMPDAAELALLRAVVYEMTDRQDAALTQLRDIERRWPEWDRPRLVHGIALVKRSDFAEARKQIENAMALGADTGEAYYYLAQTTLATAPDQLGAADNAIRRALELSPDDPYVQTLAGRIAADRGKKDEAVQHLKRAVEIMPELSQAHLQLSRLYAEAGRKEDATAEAAIVRKLASGGQQTAEMPSSLRSLFQVR